METEELARFLSGNSTKKEEEKVKAWMNESEENRRSMAEFKQIWEVSALSSDSSDRLFDTEKEWRRLNKRMGKAEEKTDRTPDQFGNRFPGRSWQMFMRVAAIFVIAALIGFIAYQNWEPMEETQALALRTITTEAAQRVNLTLSDGTKVLLNAGSEMKIPEVFDADKREVFLKGQAYFDVAENADKPFVIHSGTARTRVLGTSFSVRAYPRDEQITIAVKEGRVSFEPRNEASDTKTVVNGNEFVQFNTSTLQLQTLKMEDAGLYLGWVEGYLKFKEAPLHEVATELERRYGVSISFADTDLKKRSLTAMLKSRSIKNVLDVISMSLEINYTLDGDRVIFQQ